MYYLTHSEDKSYCVVLEEELKFDEQNPSVYLEIQNGDSIQFFYEGFGKIVFRGTVIQKSGKMNLSWKFLFIFFHYV